jgi:hypothetical protein
METKLAAALWSLNDLGSEQLPGIACGWLENGISSPTLKILAGESQPIMSEVEPMFERVLQELNIDIPTQREATILLSKIIAQEIVDGKKSPYTGAREIWMLSTDCEAANVPLIFAGLASEHEDFHDFQNEKYYGKEHCQQVIRDIEHRIIDEARKLLAEL